MPDTAHLPGWLPCESLSWPHAEHRWTYHDPATRLPVTAWCDGTTRPEAEGPCCGDELCPCATKPGWTGTGTQAMDYEESR